MDTPIKVNLSINVEFIKLARSLRDAQKEASHSQKAQRRARSLEQLFDAKLEKLEDEVVRLRGLVKQSEMPLFGSDQSNGARDIFRSSTS